MQSDLPVLVYLWAPWCGPCIEKVTTVVEEISQDFEGKIKVFKLNTDENPYLITKYGVRIAPTLFIFKGGKKVDTIEGDVDRATISSALTKHL